MERDYSVSFSTPLRESLGEVGVRVSRISNLKDLDISSGELLVTTTLCPLYARVSLAESSLIKSPAVLQDSRVYGKWEAGLQLFQSLRKVLAEYGVKPRIMFSFADRGVISRSQEEEVLEDLVYSEQLYRQAAMQDITPLGIEWELRKYSEIRPDYHLLDRPGGPLDKSFSSDRDLEARIGQMLGRLNDLGIRTSEDLNAKKIIRKMVLELGIKIAEGLLAQYGTFDAITTRPGALNAFFERSGLLLRISDLFSHGQYPRIDILC